MMTPPMNMQIAMNWLLRLHNEGPPLETASPTDKRRGTFLPDWRGRHKRVRQETLAPQSSTTSLFRHGRGVRCALGNHTHGPHGEAAMSVVLNDLLLFSCLTALVTGIVIAAATLLI
jgi:hypothetical protein